MIRNNHCLWFLLCLTFIKNFTVWPRDEWNIRWQLHMLSSFICLLLYLTRLIIVFRMTFYISSDKCLLDCKWRWLWCWKLAVGDNSGITFLWEGVRRLTPGGGYCLHRERLAYCADCYILVICITSTKGGKDSVSPFLILKFTRKGAHPICFIFFLPKH